MAGYQCDCTDRDQLPLLVSKIEAEMGAIDAVVWNAGNGVWKEF